MRPVNPEIRNVANLAKHAVRSIAGGRVGEGGAALRVMGLRLLEGADALRRGAGVTCDFCGWRGRRFKTFLVGSSHRRGAVCPRCLSLERHREFIRLFRRLRALLPSRVAILDIAPTLAFSRACRGAADVGYVSFDLVSRLAMVRGDLQRLPFRPRSFDLVLCSHVLDYVPDDVGALMEIRAALREGGLAILEHHLGDGGTEDWPAPRADELDRMRQYGSDFPDRVRRAGLDPHRVGMGTQAVFLAFKDPRPGEIESFTSAVAR